MKVYKGFNSKLQCNPTGKKPFQYEINKTYEEPKAKLCSCGFHACENPLEVFRYYSPSDSRYCEAELEDVSDEHGSNDSKRVGKKIKIGAEIGINGIVKAGVKFIFEKVDWKHAKESNTGYYSAATNTGNCSAATNTGYYSAATNTGYQSAATVKGKESIAIATGYQSKAKGALDCWIVVAEWLQNDNGEYHIKDVQCTKVDGKGIKADTFYMLKNGKFIEAE